ncbi:MAG: hypothetical protein A3A27_00275 [Candidatus Wildermuthbacteria bacterium RIFCSPLOWO2_01_FULL_47_18]|uniref:Uncharacterized protein n=1 Tax=Candidatus Wildermuthbacteria bacterium RIFCSPLOWO2_01_FULL_47_18 TaxID=1802460 RepID=A0A1G2RIZ7_9BACT|nr:MAG: hypothetical protein A3A27_00275 [Candidatus Wildermuthbacteria bacterium RIFCSPLOWO2_01_FULL_47_18]
MGAAAPANIITNMAKIIQKDGLKPEDIQFLTKLFYGLVGIASSFAFFLVLYWVLRLDSAITDVITNTYSTPLYFWPYVILTLGAIALFGVNISLLVYRWRKFGPPRIKIESGRRPTSTTPTTRVELLYKK